MSFLKIIIIICEDIIPITGHYICIKNETYELFEDNYNHM